MYSEVGIYKRKQESEKKEENTLSTIDQESDQENDKEKKKVLD